MAVDAKVRLHRGTEWHVAPDGLPTGNGTMRQPWDFVTAMTAGAIVKPGDWIWLHGGTYMPFTRSRSFVVPNLNGTRELPIIVRSYPGEWAKINGFIDVPWDQAADDGGVGQLIQFSYGVSSYVWMWDLEIMTDWWTTYGRCSTEANTSDYPIPPGDAYLAAAMGLRIINNVIHDNAQGLLSPAYPTLGNVVLYGNVSYHNGFDSLGLVYYSQYGGWGNRRGHGHHMYMQNEWGCKTVWDNIFVHGFSYGHHAYSTSAVMWGWNVQGNMSAMIGNSSRISGLTGNIFGGAGSQITGAGQSDKALRGFYGKDNSFYFPAGTGGCLDVGYGKGSEYPHVIGNWLAGGTALDTSTSFPVDAVEIENNKVYGTAAFTTGKTKANYPNNEWYTTRPTTNWIRTRPNLYERGRGHVAVFNWELRDTVDVDISSFGLFDGEAFEVRCAQGYMEHPVLEDNYIASSPTITLPMTGLPQTGPIGYPMPVGSGKEFQMFVVRKPGGY